MAYSTQCRTQSENHPWGAYIPDGARVLLIGTFPPGKQRWSFDFFYPNKSNPFWEILAQIAGKPLLSAHDSDAVAFRKLLLNELGIGITDMGKTILRHDNSALDQNIFPLEFHDIFECIDRNPSLQKIILTSSSGENSAEGWFRFYCRLNGVIFPKLKGNNPKRYALAHNGRILEVVSVHSSSRAAGRKIEEMVAMYRNEMI